METQQIVEKIDLAIEAVAEQTAQETKRIIEARRRGGLKRAQAFTPEFQRMARAHVSSESCKANGHAGGVAYVRKYGKRKLAENARGYRLEHPSDLERITERALAEIGAEGYEREGYIFPHSKHHHITGDFVFRTMRPHRVVYADGEQWHTDNTTLAGCVERGTKDKHYDNYLSYRGWQVLRLTEAEIKAFDRRDDAGAMLARLRDFLKVQGPESGASHGD